MLKPPSGRFVGDIRSGALPRPFANILLDRHTLLCPCQLTPLPTHLGLFNQIAVERRVPMVVLGGMVKVNHTIIAGRPRESQSTAAMSFPKVHRGKDLG
jgi:hypothetical protein